MHPTLNPDQARFNMIEQQIRPAAPLRDDVRQLLHLVRREDFVPPAYRHLAFADVALPLGGGAAMLAPRVEAAVVQAVGVGKREDVLVVGAGSGHLAALLSVHADHVAAVEIDASLADVARLNLRRAGIDNVAVEAGNGFDPGCGGGGMFDVIVLAGGVPRLPAVLFNRLKVRGRLFAFVGTAPALSARLVERVDERGMSVRNLFETDVAPLRDVPVGPEFVF